MTPTVGSTALPAGTSVAVASGSPCPVENLAPGTVLHGGAVVTSILELAFGSVPEAVLLQAGAIAPGAPAAALVVSPLQWIAFEDRLAPAGALANGATIQRLPASPPAWYALTTDRAGTLVAADVSLPLPGPSGIAAPFRPLAAGPELTALRASLRPPPSAPLRLMLGAGELAVAESADRLHATLPPGEGGPMTVIRLVSPPGRPRGTRDLRQFGIAILGVELDGVPFPLEDPGFGEGFHPIERHEASAWRWTDGDATLALPPSDAPRLLAIRIAPWHTKLEPA